MASVSVVPGSTVLRMSTKCGDVLPREGRRQSPYTRAGCNGGLDSR